jgi:hypothetical protein
MDTQIFVFGMSVIWMLFLVLLQRTSHRNRMIEIQSHYNLESQRLEQEHKLAMEEIKEENGGSESWKRGRDDN